MKKIIVFAVVTGLVFAVAVAVIGTAGIVYARSQAQTTNPPDGENFFGRGMMGGRGMMAGGGMMSGGGMMGASRTGEYGPMHPYMLEALSKALNLTTDELQAKLDDGLTMYEVAQGAGLSEDEITKVFTDAHAESLKAAVAAGTITQEQADWMQQHHSQMGVGGFGSGGCGGSGMLRGFRNQDKL